MPKSEAGRRPFSPAFFDALRTAPAPGIEILVNTQRFKGSSLGVPKENGVDVLDHVARHFQEATLVFERDESPLRPVVHGDLQRLGPRSHPLYVSFDPQVPRANPARALNDLL